VRYFLRMVTLLFGAPYLLDLYNDSCKIWSDGPMFFPGTNKLFFNTPHEKSDSTDSWLDITNRIWTAEIIEGKWSEPVIFNIF
jgi:hypothetical protein